VPVLPVVALMATTEFFPAISAAVRLVRAERS
jgi:hypothetical protein